VFTPDGSYVDYRLSDGQGNYSTLYRMPVLGGAARKVLFDVDTAPGYSPNGGQLVFVRNIGREEQRLVVAELDGRDERVLASRRAEDLRWFETDAGPVWSPDGRSIAVAGADSTGQFRGEVVLVDVASGRQQRLGDPGLFRVTGLDWPPGGGGLLLTAVVKGESFSPQILRLSVPGGVLSRVTNDTAAYHGVSSSGDGTKLASVQVQSDATLWRRSLRGTGADQQLTFSSRELIVALDRAADGTLFYAVRSGADHFIARLAGESREPLRLTPPGFIGSDPQVSRDGRRLVLRRLRPDGRVGLATMDSDGANVREVATRGIEGPFAVGPFALHPNEPWMVVVDGEGLWRVPLDGGEGELLLRDPRASPVAFSPSGDRLAYLSAREDAQGHMHPVLRVVPAAGGEVLAELDRARGMQSAPRWSPDGRSLVARVQQGDSSALLSFPLDGGPPSLLTDLTGLEVRDFVLDADGEWITYVRVDTSSDGVLIESFQ
jgi:Tol biopolymer transport system component